MSISKYWQLNKTFLQRHIAYRARVCIWIIADVANFLVFPFVWLAVYGSRETLAGYAKADMVTYYMVIMFISVACTSHISRHMKDDIIKGNLNAILVQPMRYLFFRTIHEVSYRILATGIAIALFGAAFFLFPAYMRFPSSPASLIFFLLSLFFSFYFSHLMQLFVGLSSFWLGDNTGPDRLRHIVEKVFSGEIAPLVFFPPLLQSIAGILPFQFLSYVPAQIFVGQLTMQEMRHVVFIASMWAAGLSVFVLFLWRRGVRRYDGVGI